MEVLITPEPPPRPFIPCSNISTALYYMKKLENGEEIGADFTESTETMAKWFVSVLN